MPDNIAPTNRCQMPPGMRDKYLFAVMRRSLCACRFPRRWHRGSGR
jgi:hypothetical protein